MFKQITNLEGNEIYLIISLLIFIVFFIGVGIRLLSMKKEYSEYMTQIPLDTHDQEQNFETEQDTRL